MRSERKEKLSPRYIVPFEILDREGTMAYQASLSPNLSSVHNGFHISVLQKYESGPLHALDYGSIKIREDLNYIEGPLRTLDQKEQVNEDNPFSLSAMVVLKKRLGKEKRKSKSTTRTSSMNNVHS